MSALLRIRYISTHYLLLLLLLVPVSCPIAAQSLHIDSKGYALGQLSGVHRERAGNRAIRGDILLGHEGNFTLNRQQVEQQPSGFIANPWSFCFEDDRYDELEKLVGSYVVLEYKTPRKSALLSCSAINELIHIYPVSQRRLLNQTQFVTDELGLHNEVSSGVEFGVITNVIESEERNRRYSLTLQVGNSGNQFRHFNTMDPDLFYFAVECLKMAVNVRIHYIEQFSKGLHYDGGTILYVWKVEILGRGVN
ncbi:hypothetical protein [Nitrosomonas cryotolerans]|nr:hypothetical protein [Nitrosomonas cryotolerans]